MGALATPTGRRLARFELVRRLGEGGMGVVYEALDRDSSARVALKTLRTFDAETLLRLKEEFRALQDIRHPNLVSLGEMMRDGDEWFFTMELVDGVGLLTHVRGSEDRVVAPTPESTAEVTQVVAQRAADGEPWEGARGPAPPRFDEARLRSSLADLARALVALHAAGKVHRDIKPSNVLVAADGRVVLLDFGLVLDAAHQLGPREDLIVGSVPYMAPEQAANDEIGPAADWYAVGVVLYQCLTGRRPFEGAGALVLTRKLAEDPPPPSTFVDGIPFDLESLCMELLRRDPALRPQGPNVVRRLTSPRPPSGRPASVPPPASPPRAPFVGRSGELASLSAALERVDAGETVSVVVRGESGVGKSAVVRRFTQVVAAARSGSVVLAGRCYELEIVPYKAFDGLMDALSRHLALLDDAAIARLLPGTAWLLGQVFPVLRRVPALDREMASAAPRRPDMHEARARLFATVRELFTKLGEQRLVLLVIDDLHWADPDSLALLAELMRPPLPPHLLLVVTTRSAAPLAGLPGEVVTLTLDALPDGEAVDLARQLLARDGLADDALASTIAADAAGHPLFVDELVRHARERGGKAPGRLHLDDALLARVARLADAERALLEVLAVAGVSLSHRVAMRAAGLELGHFARHASVLRAAHLARSGGQRGTDAIEPYHDRVREAVAGRLDEARRRDCHARIAGALEEQGAVDADALATHWLNAGELARAAVYARRAADEAFESLAFGRAARLYERALDLPVGSEEERQALHVRHAEALANAGRSVDAGTAFARAAEHAAGQRALDLRRRAAEQLLIGGRIDAGTEALREVSREIGIWMPTSLFWTVTLLLFFRAVLHVRGLGYAVRDEKSVPRDALLAIDVCWAVARTLAVTDHILGAYFQARMLLLALRCGEPVRLANALALETGYLAIGGRRKRARAVRVLEKCYALARRVEHPEALAIATGVEGFAALVQGRNRDAVTLNERGLEVMATSTAGFMWEVRAAKMNVAWALYFLGENERLTKLVHQAVREAEDRGDLAASTVYRTGVLNTVWLYTGDSATARQVALDAARGWTARGYHNQHYWSFFALLQIDLYEGKGREAYERALAEWPRMRRGFILEMEILHVEALHGRARAAVLAASQEGGAERDRLLSAAARAARRLARFDYAPAAPLAALIRAGACSVRGDRAGADRELEGAVSGLDALSAGAYAAAARWQLGRLRGGEPGDALVRQAEAWFERQRIAEPARAAAFMVPGFSRA